MSKFKFSKLAIAAFFSLPTLCMFATPKAAVAQNYYGAIAYSQSSDAHGYSYDYYSQGEAEARALQECYNYSGSYDCVVTIWFRNACGALATTPNGAYGSAWGVNQAVAERNALETCSQYGQGCRVTRWVCTTR